MIAAVATITSAFFIHTTTLVCDKTDNRPGMPCLDVDSSSPLWHVPTLCTPPLVLFHVLCGRFLPLHTTAVALDCNCGSVQWLMSTARYREMYEGWGTSRHMLKRGQEVAVEAWHTRTIARVSLASGWVSERKEGWKLCFGRWVVFSRRVL